MRTEWSGAYIDGRSAARQRATIHLTPTGLHVATEDGGSFWWPYGEVRQTQGFYAGEEVRLERGEAPAPALLVPDTRFLTALRAVATASAARFHDPGRRRWRGPATVAAALAVVVAIPVLYLWVIPVLAALAATRVPVSWEERLGQGVVDHLAPASKRCADPGRVARVEELVRMLTAAAPREPYTFRVIVVDDRAVNALAAPGGSIVVFLGLLERTRRPEELAGVLAHEVQHVLRRHATRALLQRASISLLASALAGDPTGAGGFGLEGAQTLGALAYSREFEAEADREGMRMLARAGIDPTGMIEFFEALLKDGGKTPGLARYLSTHPSLEERVAALRALARESPGRRVPLFPGYDWHDMTRICAR